jgi:hypothetical protein
VNELLGYFDNDNGFPDINLPARDKSLSFHWRARRSFFTDLFGSTGNPAKDDARNSVLTEAVLAYEAGQWVSYSRSHDFYSGRRPLSHRRGRNRFITGTASPRAFAHADRDGDGSHARRPSRGRARW